MLLRRLGAAAAATIVLLVAAVAAAAPASAHTITGVAPTDYRSELTGVEPSVPGVRVELLDLGRRVRLTNSGPEVVVLGYQGEPYLRVGPKGVYENTRSPSTYQNKVSVAGAATTNTT